MTKELLMNGDLDKVLKGWKKSLAYQIPTSFHYINIGLPNKI